MDHPESGQIRCQNCGHMNPADATYCENCGTRLRKDLNIPPQFPERDAPARPEPSPLPASFTPLPPAGPQPKPSAGDEGADWRMSSLGPPPRPKRRLWLWILLGILIFCVIICVLLAVFSALLQSGNAPGWLQDFATNAAVQATKEAK